MAAKDGKDDLADLDDEIENELRQLQISLKDKQDDEEGVKK